MTIYQMRTVVQHIFFIILTYGHRAGIFLGTSLPCLSCPYVTGCGGWCYLHRLQSDLALPLAALLSSPGQEALVAFAVCMALLMLFGKSWCGWVCPFGLLQDWLSRIRTFLGIREARWSEKTLSLLRKGKYLMLGLLVCIPLFATHVDLFRPFCAICPAKTLMPIIGGGSKEAFWLLDATNSITLSLSFILMSVSGGVVIGMFFKQRFFCFFCPISALMHIVRPLALLRIIKQPPACHGCGTCSRVCPVDLDMPHTVMQPACVQGNGCTGCFRCVDSCCSGGALRITFGPLTVFTASRKHAAKGTPRR